MFIQNIKLYNFRNHHNICLNFDHKIVNILGANGVGKTSILESFTTFINIKCFRQHKLENLIRSQQHEMMISMQINDLHDVLLLKYDIFNKRKRIYLNDNLLQEKQYLKDLHFLCFSPQIYANFLYSMTNRRQFFDRITYAFFPDHLQLMLDYMYLKQQRQKMLWHDCIDPNLLDVIEKKIACLILKIMKNRAECLKIINNNIDTNININLSGIIEDKLCAQKEDALLLQDIFHELSNNRILSKQKNRMHCGPHLSNLEICYFYKNFDQCSAGEQKKILLEILLAQAKAHIQINKQPILLLDDIVSQLDDRHMNILLEKILAINIQTFITYVADYLGRCGQVINLT